MKAIRENVDLACKKQRNVPFASLKQINDELDRLEKMGVLSKVDYSEWASPTVCVCVYIYIYIYIYITAK